MATATDQHMSLAVAPRGSSSHLNRPAKQFVPAFLQKLYEMVNDPADQDLIRWSDTGDSFFVLDQERFASEVLGRWFKHKNFSSFVRQLNMYGFHKIPHLQQGVLRADSNTEFWNFEHPHFLRGQPDLLCLIQRKKQAATMGDDTHVAPAAGKDAGSGAVGALSPNQLLDINSIVNGIQVIKRHQAAISADLNELKSSNQHLWQEAMTARERHKKHQDTINRILKFLASVFGHGDDRMRKDEDAPHTVVSRKPQRLMIADGRAREKMETNEGSEEDSRSSLESARSANSADLFGSMGTPSVAPSEPFMTRFASVESNFPDAPTPTEPRPAAQEARSVPSAPPPNATNTTPLPTSTPTPATPTQANNDHVVQAALTSVLNSPTQMQKLLAALASQSIGPEVLSPAGQPYYQQHLIAPSPYNSNNPQQYTPGVPKDTGNVQPNAAAPGRLPQTLDYASASALTPFTLPLLGSPSDPDPYALQEQDERLQKTYKTTTEINNDVDELQTSIQSLIQSLGIDPTSLDSSSPTETPPSVSGGASAPPPHPGDVDMYSHVSIGAPQDFDFDSFLMDMPRASEEDGDLDKLAERLDPSIVPKVPDSSKIGSASTEQLHAFFDDVVSQDGPPLHGSHEFKVSLGPGAGVGPGSGSGAGTGARGRKRKSDVIVDGAHTYAPQEPQGGTMAPATPSITGNRSKRKR